MKRAVYLVTLAIFTLCFSMKASADTIVEIDGIYFKIFSSSKTVIVIKPTMANQNNEPYSGNITIPGSITNNNVSYPVTEIDKEAFKGCILTNLTLPGSIIKIGNDAFKDCSITNVYYDSWEHLCSSITYANANANPYSKASSLYFSSNSGQKVTQWIIPEGVTSISDYAFYGKSNHTSVQLPSTLTTIGKQAFDGCSGLTEITIPQSVRTIGESAFRGCNGLTKVRYASIEDLCNISFVNTDANPLNYAHHLYLGNENTEATNIHIPSISTIGIATFAGGEEIRNISIPSSVTFIRRDAFSGCKKLAFVDFDSQESILNMKYENIQANPLYYASYITVRGSSFNTVTLNNDSVNNYLFANAKWLEEVVIDPNVKYIGVSSFEGCKNLKSVKIKGDLKRIDYYAFKGCNNLESINLEASSQLAFIGAGAFYECYKLQRVTIPASITSLTEQSFYRCTGLQDVRFLTTNITEIPKQFFFNCGSLKNVELSSSITTIKEEAFKGCSSLTTLPSGGNINVIKSSAFSNCIHLQTIEFPSTIRNIENSAFSGCTELTQIIIQNPGNEEDEITIGAAVFSNCNNLKSIYSYATKAPKADVTAFGDATGINLFLAENCDVTTYTVAPWSNFSTPITMSAHTITWYVDGVNVHQDNLLTGDHITPYSIQQSGWDFSGWQEEIPSIMPDQDLEFHGFFTKTKYFEEYSDLTFRLDPVAKEATLLPSEYYKELNWESLTIPDFITFKDKNYENSTYTVTAIADDAFSELKLIDIHLPEHLKTIGKGAFYKCSELAGISLPAGVTVISDSLFYGCTNLVGIEMSDAVTEIGASAFNECRNLNLQHLPSGLQKIGSLAFCYCKSITEVSIPATVSEMKGRAFQNCEALESVVFDPQCPLTLLPNSTFQNCYNLKSFKLPNSLKYINASAFLNCQKLEIAAIPEGITNISELAFSGCQELKEVIIPKSTQSIGREAFKGCKKITQVTVDRETAPSAAINIFDSSIFEKTKAKLLVPSGAIENYSSKAPWNNFGDNIVAREQHSLKYLVDGQDHNSSNLWTGDFIEPLAYPTKGDHEFSGWRNLPTTMPNSDVVVTGAFKYSLTYKNADKDSLLYQTSLFCGDSIKNPKELDSLYYIYKLEPSLETMPDQDMVVSVRYLLSECEFVDDNDIRYYLYIEGDNQHAEVMPNKYDKKAITIPDSVNYLSKNYPVTVIQANAFKNSNKLQSISLPNTLRIIGTRAFQDCHVLSSITIPESVDSIGNEVFMYCYGLKEADIKANVSRLPTQTFLKCQSLTKVTLSDNIKTIGRGAFFDCNKLTTLPTSGSVETIDNEAFAKCLNIQTLELPSTIQKVGEKAFVSCDSLKQLIIKNPDHSDVINLGDSVFSNCKNLKSIYSSAITAPIAESGTFGGKKDIKLFLAENVDRESYGRNPWSDFEEPITISPRLIIYHVDGNELDRDTFNIGETVIPRNIPAQDGWTFSGWQEEIPAIMPDDTLNIHGFFTRNTKIGDFYYRLDPVNKQATVIGDESYKTNSYEDIIIPATVSEESDFYETSSYDVVAIADTTFKKCEHLESVQLPESIVSIGKQAFAQCTGLTGIKLPTGVTVLSDSLFYGCQNLLSATFGENVTKIGKSAFNKCRSLNIDTLPANLQKIDTLAFCYTATSGLTIPASVTDMGERVFQNCEELRSIVFDAQSQLTALPSNTFQNCYKLESFVLPPSITEIKGNAFSNCRRLEIVNIPSGITRIQSSAFSGCQGLKKIIIPQSVESLASKVFDGCLAIEQLTVDKETAPTATTNTFDNSIYETAKLYVPKSDDYKAHSPWKLFGDNIIVREQFTLTYMVDGQQDSPIDTLWAGDPIEARNYPEKEGREFSGWKNLPATMPDSNIVVTGAFQYNITYKTEDKDSVLFRDNVFYGDTITIPTAEIDSIGYANKFDQKLPIVMPAKDITVKVSYLVSECEYTFGGLRYYIYTQPKNNIKPHAEVMPGETPYSGSSYAIPSSIPYLGENYDVTVIRNDAFNSCKDLVRITLPTSITSIGTRAFRECINLTEFNMPESVDTIGNEVFMSCYQLETVNFPGMLLKTMPANTFQNCESLTDVDLPNSLVYIRACAFNGCKKLETIVLPNSLKTIGERAFTGCSNLRSVTIENGHEFPDAKQNSFDESTYNEATLYCSSNLPVKSPWDSFRNQETTNATAEQVLTPTISYIKGKLVFACATEGVTFVSDVTVADACEHRGQEKGLTQKYEISVYATKTGSKRSKTATAYITWRNGKPIMEGFTSFELQDAYPKRGDVNEDGTVSAQDASLIQQYVAKKISW